MSLFPSAGRFEAGKSHNLTAHGLRLWLDAETAVAVVVARIQDDKAGEITLASSVTDCIADNCRIDGYDLTPSQRRWIKSIQVDAEDWESATRAMRAKGGAQ